MTYYLLIGGSSELPMWLTGCFLVTYFGRWWGLYAYTVILKFVRELRGRAITVWELFMCGGDIHVQLPYTVINVWRAITMWRGTSRAATVHGNP